MFAYYRIIVADEKALNELNVIFLINYTQTLFIMVKKFK